MDWPQKTAVELQRAVFDALDQNTSYSRGDVLGFPGSYLDRKVFPPSDFLHGMPYLTCLRENPNHIGCHTVTQSETAFAGTQAIERDLLRLCAEEILRAPADSCDGYVAPGGSECNIQALWVQRNLLRDRFGATAQELLVLYSEDTHYSIAKAVDLLVLPAVCLPVDAQTRQIRPEVLRSTVLDAKRRGVRFLVLVLNMGTTMFGSVDDIAQVHAVLRPLGVDYRIHVDAAFGGFIYPFTAPDNALDFADPTVVSVSLDGHKMLQAPYGTGVFLARKQQIEHVCTAEARYVHGKDYTLCGSRSGANCIALWMILYAYGAQGGRDFLRELVQRTDKFCRDLEALDVRFFRQPHMNVVALHAADVPDDLAQRFLLVPDTHEGPPAWWKIVVMDHVRPEVLAQFVAELAVQRLDRSSSAA